MEKKQTKIKYTLATYSPTKPDLPLPTTWYMSYINSNKLNVSKELFDYCKIPTRPSLPTLKQ